MKHTPSQRFGILLLLFGLILIMIWGYVKAWKLQEISKNTVLQEVSSSIQDLNTSIPVEVKKTLSMGIVELYVEDKKKVGAFYRDIVGFDTQSESGNVLNLWENGETFLRLIEEKNFTAAPKTEAGLYHIAITHNSRKDLAVRLANILSKTPERYQWSADHNATEAFYFSDPEGNGLELYYDKPRKDWVWKDGKPVMGSTYIDHINYIEKYSEVPVSEWITTMGHVHLKVGNIPEAVNFYEKTLLFEEMNNRGDALFVSRDKYHHHLGMNTWLSLGAGKRTKNTYGLKSFEIQYHDMYLYEQVRNNLRRDGYPWEFSPPSSIKIEDPWGNTIVIIAELPLK